MLDDSEEAFPDELGLREAYSSPEGVVRHGDHLYVAGTRSPRDVADDMLIPFKMVHKSERYGHALEALKQGQGRVRYLVGHSLGGAISARLLEDHPEIQRDSQAPNVQARFRSGFVAGQERQKHHGAWVESA